MYINYYYNNVGIYIDNTIYYLAPKYCLHLLGDVNTLSILVTCKVGL